MAPAQKQAGDHSSLRWGEKKEKGGGGEKREKGGGEKGGERKEREI